MKPIETLECACNARPVDEDLVAQFAADGVIVLRSAFSGEDAAFLRDMVWRHVEYTTPVRLRDAGTWRFDGNFALRTVEARPVWEIVHGNRTLVHALDLLFGVGNWRPPGAPQVLLTFPSSRPWTWPAGWHIDFGWDMPTWPVPAVKLFALLDSVEEAGGGTLLLEGSHRLVEELATTDGRPVDPWDAEKRPLVRYPELKEILTGHAGRARLGQQLEVGGVTVRPVEITGAPGDIVVTHIQVFHSPSPNVSDRPRQMMGNAVRRAEHPTQRAVASSAHSGRAE